MTMQYDDLNFSTKVMTIAQVTQVKFSMQNCPFQCLFTPLRVETNKTKILHFSKV